MILIHRLDWWPTLLVWWCIVWFLQYTNKEKIQHICPKFLCCTRQHILNSFLWPNWSYLINLYLMVYYNLEFCVLKKHMSNTMSKHIFIPRFLSLLWAIPNFWIALNILRHPMKFFIYTLGMLKYIALASLVFPNSF